MIPRIVLLSVAAFAAACGNGSSCLPPVPTAACAAGTFVDASTSDPICLSSTGLPLCRGNMAYCYICSGAAFDDNCTIEDKSGASTECVHSCDKC